MQLLQMGTFLHKYTEFKNWLLQSIVQGAQRKMIQLYKAMDKS